MADLRAEIQRVTSVLRSNTTPIFFLSRFGAHLRGVERWVPALHHIAIPDVEAGAHFTERHFAPSALPPVPLSATGTVNWLLRDPEVRGYIASNTPAGETPHVVFSEHDSETESLCAELGYTIMSAPIALRRALDSKLRLADIAVREDLHPVPHVVATVSTWDELCATTSAAGIGQHVVIQTAYGEGGDSTWFVTNQAEFDAASGSFANEPVRIMRYVKHQPLAIEAVATRDGVIVGPLERDIIGHSEVAIYGGSSSGLEYAADLIDHAGRAHIISVVERLGNALIEEGFRGAFEVDFLLDVDTGKIYFGEMNPRFSGCGMVSNATTAGVWGIPFYALHLLEFLDHDLQLHPQHWNTSWSTEESGDEWSNIMIRHLNRSTQVNTTFARTGVYRIADDWSLEFVRSGSDWFDLRRSDEVFYLAYHWPNRLHVYGDTIGLLILRERAQDANAKFTDRAKRLIQQVHALYVTRSLTFVERLRGAVKRRAALLVTRL